MAIDKDKIKNKTIYQSYTSEGIRVQRNKGTITYDDGIVKAYDSVKLKDMRQPDMRPLKYTQEVQEAINKALVVDGKD